MKEILKNSFTKFLLKILRKSKITGKIIGGYYPYNYEVDIIEILKKLEKLQNGYFLKKNLAAVIHPICRY